MDCYNTEAGTGDAWRAINRSTDSDEKEELVFTVHGIVLQCDLPPIVKPLTKNSSAKHVQQRVVLTGLNTPTFDKAIQGLMRIDDHLRSNIREEGTLDFLGEQGSHTTLEVSNRYFTSKRVAKNEDHIPFSSVLDPKGILEEMRGESLIHTAENQVEYYERYYIENEPQ
ncbi:hypothetical protein VNI00_011842 [Paramarasmius palmivorus]|uniref:Uncharacterized protein n=1 Tax=Paramarasmius palmivorus TaxID=297713 RepID=A0AAW0CAK9_9AGAR